MFKQTQRSFAGGWLDKELMGRTDLAKYYTGAEKIENLLVRRQGSLSKRRGTNLRAKISDLLGTFIDVITGEESVGTVGRPRLVPIVYERETGYYALFAGRRAFLVGDRGVYCEDGEWRRDIPPYYWLSNDSGRCAPAEAECFVNDIPYPTVAVGMRLCAAGHVVKLARDVEVSGSKLVCRGRLDLNGHTMTVRSANTYIYFRPNSRAGEVGLMDSTMGRGRIVWDVDEMALDADRCFLVASGGVFVVDGVYIDYPFTGSEAAFAKINTAVISARFSSCHMETSAGRGFADIYGNYSGNADRAVRVEDCDLYVSTGGVMFRNAAAANAQSTAYRPIVLLSGRYKGDSGTNVANAGVEMRGGWVSCDSLGGSSRNTRIVAGLVKTGMSVSVAQGSVLKRASAEPPEPGAVNVDNYNLVSEGDYVYSAPPDHGEGEDPQPLWRTAPYSIGIPYEDGDLAELDTYQSGDTIFIAHKNYPPAKLTFLPDETRLGFEVISFNATAWRRPRISSVSETIHPAHDESSVSGSTTYRTETRFSTTSSACTKTTSVYKEGTSSDTLVSSSTSTLPVRTVHYVATYVKDGVESAPSNPVSVTYGAPWESGGVVKLSLDRGDNAEEPDFYNVYKKEYTDFGLIGSTLRSAAADPVPEVQSVDTQDGETVVSDPVAAPTGRFNGVALADADMRDVAAPVEGGVVTDVASRVVGALGEYSVFRGVGGAMFDTAARFVFGDQSAASVRTVRIWFDLHELVYVENPATGKVKVYDRVSGSGKGVTVTATYRNRTGSQATATQSATATLPPISYTPEGGEAATAYTGEVTHYCGEFEPGTPAAALRAAIGREPRYADFVFSSITAARQIVRLDVVCADEDDNEVAAALCGVEFGVARESSSTFEDDYITPDMSLTPPSQEASFRGRGNYPSSVGIYQQRLIFAATGNQPATFWMSATGDLYTFAPHPSAREDDALEATLAATEFPNINHIVMGHDIIMFGDGGEWKVAPISGNAITYKTVSATLQSSIGSAKWLKPIVVGNEVVFAERTGMTLRSVSYNYVSDGYDSTDLTVLAGGIFAGNRIERMCYKQHPDSTIVCALRDGTLAALVYMREHEVVAWSRHVLGGGWLAADVATCKALDSDTTDTMLVVRRDGEWELWGGRPDSHVMTVADQVCLDACRTMTGAEAAAQGAWLDGWVAVDLATGEVASAAAGLAAERSYAVGYPIRSELVTVRPEPSPQDTVQFELKNVKSVEARTISAGEYSVKSLAAGERVPATKARTPVPVSGGAVARTTADATTLVFGANSGDGRVQIVHEDVWPMSLLQLSVNYEIQPLSNAAG